MEGIEIKKVISNLYKVNYSQSKLSDGDELIINDGVNEFTELFKSYNFEKNFIVTPQGYEKGLCFKKIGEIYNNPTWYPEIVKFSFNIFGLKKNSIYKLSIIGRDTGANNIVTKNRSLIVTNSENESLINSDLSGVNTNREYHSIFRAVGSEEVLFFSIGKIVIKDIIIDEVELKENIEKVEKDSTELIDNTGKIKTVAYGIFSQILMDDSNKKRYSPLSKYSGSGINLYYDKEKNSYLLERDNREDTINSNFNDAEFFIDINRNKLENSELAYISIDEISNDISPNTLKNGFLRFSFKNKDGMSIANKTSNGRLYIFINKIL